MERRQEERQRRCAQHINRLGNENTDMGVFPQPPPEKAGRWYVWEMGNRGELMPEAAPM